MTVRKALSKRIRFAVFARDGFRCRYCGRQSDEVPLVVDHLIAVANGGTDDEENLVTSCEPCNQGKAATVIDQTPAEDPYAHLRRQQEIREQTQAAEAASVAAAARLKVQDQWIEIWCKIRQREDVQAKILPHLVSLSTEHGPAKLIEWIEIAHNWKPWAQDYRIMKYIYGIRRRLVQEGRL